MGGTWGDLDVPLGPRSRQWGSPRGHLGATWGHLRSLDGHLDVTWTSLGVAWVHMGLEKRKSLFFHWFFNAFLVRGESCGSYLGLFEGHLGVTWASLGRHLGVTWASLVGHVGVTLGLHGPRCFKLGPRRLDGALTGGLGTPKDSPWTIQEVPGTKSRGARTHQGCTKDAPRRHQGCTEDAPGMHQGCTRERTALRRGS